MMKKLLVTLACLVMMGGIIAQEEHLSFKGVPINGTLKQYTDTMVKKGFHSEGIKDGFSVLTGDFAGYKNCVIRVATLKKCDVVSHIEVLFPETELWPAIIDDYNNLKSLLTEKYGEPELVREEFTKYHGNDNALKIYAINGGELEWYTVFSTELGDIELTLAGGSVGYKARVRLSYYDRVNTETVKQSALDDL